jgi:hypothetical protein
VITISALHSALIEQAPSVESTSLIHCNQFVRDWRAPIRDRRTYGSSKGDVGRIAALHQ